MFIDLVVTIVHMLVVLVVIMVVLEGLVAISVVVDEDNRYEFNVVE